jgi:hypothetical protein
MGHNSEVGKTGRIDTTVGDAAGLRDFEDPSSAVAGLYQP